MDFKNLPHNRRTWFPAYSLTLQSVTTILLGIRLISRFQRTGGRLGIDDLFISLAFIIATISHAAILVFNYKYGLDRHIWDVPSSSWGSGLFIAWLTGGLFLWSTALTKLSVLLFYRRLVAGTCSKAYKIALIAGMVFIATYTVLFWFLFIFTCKPVDAFWRRFSPTYNQPHKCTKPRVQARVSELTGSLSVITDFYSVLLPALLVMKMNITGRQRLGLMLVFGLGFTVVIAGVVRTYYLSRVSSTNIDKTWSSFNVFVAGMMEEHLAIICASAPSLKSCFRSFFNERFTTRGTKATSRYHGSNPPPPSQPSVNHTNDTQKSNVMLFEEALQMGSIDSDKSRIGSLPSPSTPGKSSFTLTGASPPEPHSWLDKKHKEITPTARSVSPPSFINFTTNDNRNGDPEPNWPPQLVGRLPQ